MTNTFNRRFSILFFRRSALSGLVVLLCLMLRQTAFAQQAASQAAVLKTAAEIVAAKAARTPAEQKISDIVLQKISALRSAGITQKNAILKQTESANDPRGVQMDKDARLYVYVHPAKNASYQEVYAMLAARGAKFGPCNETFNLIQAWVYYEDIAAVASEALVGHITPVLRPHTRTGSVTSEGDAASRADVTRSLYGVSGNGIKVGVLSDGCDSYLTSIASGNLIGVQVIDNSAGGDEGTAMMEIVQDLAPKAGLAFATAFGGHAGFINNIQALANVGCKVICDDVFYYDEPVFEDGDIAKEIDAVATSKDVVYASSAGNDNLESYASNLYNGVTPTILALPGTVHNFDGDQSITYVASSTSIITLRWADPQGASSNDYDLYVINLSDNTIVGSSTTIQNGTQNPYEEVDLHTAGTYRIVVNLVSGNPVPFRLSTSNRGQNNPLSSPGPSLFSSTSGHSNSLNALCCGTVYGGIGTGSAGYEANGTRSTVEQFSSVGPSPFYVGGYPNSPTVRQKPDVVGYDGVSTSLASFSPFYGTSAAAPHVAAVAALVRSVNPTLTASQVRDIIRNTALDLGVPGVDSVYGYGRVDAFNALGGLLGKEFLHTANNPIPDNSAAGISDTLVVTGTGTIDSLALSFSTSSAKFGDLVVTLKSPQGTTRTIIDRPGLSAGSSTATVPHLLLSNSFTSSVNSIASGTNLVGGYYSAPDLLAFHGEPVAGKWVLTVIDSAAGNTGTLRQWGIVFNGSLAVSAPTITSTAPTQVALSDNYSYQVLASGNPAPTFSLSNQPSGMTINAATGVITYPATTVGNFSATVTASNSQGTGSQNFSFAVVASSWLKQSAPSVASSYFLWEVYPVDSVNVWTIGTPSSSGGVTKILRSTNGGSTWTNNSGNFPSTTASNFGIYVAAADSQTALVGRADGSLYRTTNGGTSWSAVALSPAGVFIDAIQFVNPTTVYVLSDPAGAATNGWLVYKSTNAGASFTKLSNSPNSISGEGGWNNSMVWLDANHGWFGTNSSHVFHTTDGGATWASGSTSNANTEFISALNNSTVFTGGSNNPPIEVSTNGGTTFTNGSGDISGAPSTLSAVPNSTTLYASVGSSVYKSTNSGSNWTKETLPQSASGSLTHLKFISTQKGWGVGGSGLIVSYDAGRLTGTPTSANPPQPRAFNLAQNYPNPFNPSTMISYQLASASNVKLQVYDVLGREVATLVNERQAQGMHNVKFNANALASGVYFYRLQAGDFTQTKKMILVK
jgi:subtilisin-like proprotein convertase family protein/photosystem II stability/assembly factor-like uncharacterized protein